MAQIKLKGVAAIMAKIERVLKDIPKKTMEEVGDFAADRIVAQARGGKTMNVKTVDYPKIKKLSKGYIKQRESYVSGEKEKLKGKKGAAKKIARSRLRKETGSKVDSDFFEPKKSNLTRSGQYLKSIKTKSVSASEGRIVVAAMGSRNKWGNEKKVPSNSELAGYLKKQGRSIFALDQKAVKRIKQMILEAVRKQLARNRLRK